jgi:hypothetical protein
MTIRAPTPTGRTLRVAGIRAKTEATEISPWPNSASPQNQLELIWLLDYFHSHPEAVPRLKLRLLNLDLIGFPKKGLGEWRPPLVDVTEKELATASAVWQAYRAATPEACFGQLAKDLSALPSLRPVLLELLDELPSATTGLGATEMRMLELIGRGYSLTNELFIEERLRQTRVFDQWQCGYLLDGLAFGPKPAISGLDDKLRTSAAKMTGIVNQRISAAGSRSPISAGPCSRTKKTSAATIGSTAGGAARI